MSARVTIKKRSKSRSSGSQQRKKGQLTKRQIAAQVINDLTGEMTDDQDPRAPGRIRKYLPPEKGRYWNTDDPDTPEGRLGRYNPEDWHAPARDEKGHSDSITVPFHPAVIDELSAIVNSGKFPLRKSIKQAIRVAVSEFIFVLHRMDPMPDSSVNIIETAHYLNQHAEVIAGYEEKFQTGKQKAHKLYAMGATNEARKHVHDLITLAKKIDSPELSDKYVGELRREFRGLLRTKSRVRTNVKRNVNMKRARRRAAESEQWDF